MVVWLAVGLAGLFAAWAVVWLSVPRPQAAAGAAGAGDPYAEEVARFRREVADWDRRG
jgi:hypothetical protein